MSTLLTVAVYDTESNMRSRYTVKHLNSMLATVNFNKHRLFVSDNGSCNETQIIYSKFREEFDKRFPHDNLTIRKNGRNLGTANAISLGWKTRKEGDYVTKQDNDFTVQQIDWIDILEEAIEREPLLGIVGLKRFDLEEHPLHENKDWRTKLVPLPHKRGEKWINVEQCTGVFGTMQLYNPKLIEKIGYLKQPKTGYGFDDVLMNLRCKLAGFAQAYLPSIIINYLDIDENPYWKEKEKIAAEGMPEFEKMKQELLDGGDIYFEPLWTELE